MQSQQWQWGINQWVEYLRDKEIPVLPRTRDTLAALEAAGDAVREKMSTHDFVQIVYADPYLALKLLRRAEDCRLRALGNDATTPLAAVLLTGYNELKEIVAASPLLDDVLPGCRLCETRAVMAATIARAWASRRVDVLPDEVAMAALLAETGELLLWHFAPEMTAKEVRVAAWNDRYWALQRRPSQIEFTFRQLSVALAQAWGLPQLIVLLIKGTDTPRANIARLAADAAKWLCNEPQVADFIPILQELHAMLPSVSELTLAAELPLDAGLHAQLLAQLELQAAGSAENLA